MAARGEAGKALGTGLFFSFLGGFFSFLILFFISPPLAKLALKFAPFEYFAIAIFSLTMIASVSTGSTVKGAYKRNSRCNPFYCRHGTH